MKKQDHFIYKWIYQNHKQAIYMTALLVILSSIFSVSFIYVAWLSKQVLDSFIGKQSYTSSFLFMIGIVIVMQVILSVIIGYLRIYIQTKLERKMRKDILKGFYQTDFLTYQNYHLADYMTRLTSDIDVVADGIVGILPDLFSMLTQIFVGIWVLFLLNKNAAYVILIAGLVFFIVFKLFGNHFRYLHQDIKRNRSQLRITMDEFLENLVIIKTFQLNDILLNQLSKKMNQYEKSRIKQTIISAGSSGLMYLLMIFGYFFILIWGAYQISIGLMTFGSLVAFQQIIDQLQKPLKGLTHLLTKYNSLMVSSERIIEIESLKKEMSINESKNSVNWDILSIKDVSYAYTEQTVLSHFSAIIKKGEISVFTGVSGIGKTTLFSLLLGLLQQQEGSIYFDGLDGKVSVGVNTRSMFAYVPQGNHLFHGTIRENLNIVNQKITDDTIWEILEIVSLKKKILALPEQLDTQLHQSGDGLSEGQKQRLAIARALLSEAEILLLDEATSALDDKTEQQIWHNLKQLSNKTIICISHRPEAMRICDQEIKMR